MQVGEWKGRGMGMSSEDQVCEMQLDGRMGWVMGMSSVYRVRSIVRVGEMSSTNRVGQMQFGKRMGWVMRSTLLDSCLR